MYRSIFMLLAATFSIISVSVAAAVSKDSVQKDPTDGKLLGSFTGRQLHQRAVKMALPVYGREIFELAPLQ